MDDAEATALFAEGVAHWNAERFWDAHESWERLWLTLEGDTKRWLQGLIQYAAAFHHFQRGHVAGAFSRLLVAAEEKTAGYAGPTWSLDWPTLEAALQPWRVYGVEVGEGAAFPVSPAPFPRAALRA